MERKVVATGVAFHEARKGVDKKVHAFSSGYSAPVTDPQPGRSHWFVVSKARLVTQRKDLEADRFSQAHIASN
jgi:hypothetical protein